MTLALKSALTIGSILGARRLAQVVDDIDLDDVLSIIGLERRHSAAASALPAIGMLALGAVVGATAALALAPSSGRDLRQKLSSNLEGARDKLEEAAQQGMRSHSSSRTASS